MSLGFHTATDIVVSPLYDQLREFSAAKKTCVLHVSHSDIDAYLVLKFGKPSSFYIQEKELNAYISNLLRTSSILSQEMYDIIANENLSFQQLVIILARLGILEKSEDAIRILASELFSYILLDKKSKFFHISQNEFHAVLQQDEYMCLLKASGLCEVPLGQSVLDVYDQAKIIERIYSQGNALRDVSHEFFSIGAVQYDSNCITIDSALISVPGLRSRSLKEVIKKIEDGLVEIVNAEENRSAAIKEMSLAPKVLSQDHTEHKTASVKKKDAHNLAYVFRNIAFLGAISAGIIAVKLYFIFFEFVRI